MLKHCYFEPGSLKLLEKLAAENKSLILVMGHVGNWEWAGNTVSLCCTHQLHIIYHPLRNKYFNGLIYRMRTRFGSKLIAMKDTFRAMLSNRQELNVTAFIADQTPSSAEAAYWTTFMNQDTPIFRGTELISRKINYPVVYGSIRKVKRGYYELLVEMLCESPKDTQEDEISEMHTRRLEKDIIKNPELWLWSHRRWKRKKPTN